MPLTARSRAASPAWAIAAFGAIVSFAAPARADEPVVQRCADAYVNGQHLLRERHFVRARAALLLCARDPCPASLQPECVAWLNEADRAQPTVVISARDAQDHEIPGARVTLDGAPFMDHLDGTAQPVDPGEHVFHVTAPGLDAEQHVTVREGEKVRPLVFRAPAPPASSTSAPPSAVMPVAPPAPRAAPMPRWPAYALGGLSLAASATFVYFGVSGLSLRHELEACRPTCAEARVHAGNVDWTVADVSLAVAVVSLAAAIYVFLKSEPAPGPSAVAVTF